MSSAAKAKRMLRKVALSDWLAALALVVSVLALWRSWEADRPRIQMAEVGAYSGRIFDSQVERLRMLAIHPLLVTNAGGRRTTLIGFRPRAGLPPLVALRGEQHLSPDFPVDFFVTDKIAAEIAQSPQAIRARENLPLDRLALLNIALEGGDSKVVAVAFLADPYDKTGARVAEYLLFTLEAIFADGTTRLLTSAFRVPEREGGASGRW